jgi:WD40 repeat protein
VRTCVSQIDSSPVTLLAFIVQAEGAPSPFQFATGGEGELRFWKVRGRNATSSLHSNQASRPPRVTAMASLRPAQLITGDAEGHISIWEGRDFVKMTESAHTDMISALSKYESRKFGSGLISASNDALIFWSENYEVVMRFPIAEMLGKINRPYTSNAYVSTVSVDAGCRRMLVALQSSYVLEYAMDSGAVLLVTEAHSLGKLSAVAAHPLDARFVCSCGADGLLRVWNVSSRRPVAVASLGAAATSMAFRAAGDVLAISVVAEDEASADIVILSFDGTSDKYVTIVDRVQNVGTSKISALRYSPDEKLLVASSLDGKLYCFSVDKGYKVRAIVTAHQGPVHSFDFSVSGRYLRSFGKLRGANTNSAEMHIHDVSKQVEAGLGSGGGAPSFGLLRDEKDLRPLVGEQWATLSPACPEVRGARQVERYSGVGVTDVVSHGSLCAAGYSDGTAKLFRHPPASLDAEGLPMGGHSSGGTKCAFTCDGRSLVVVGAADGSIVVWEMKQ